MGPIEEVKEEVAAEEVVPEAPKISDRAARLIDFIERAKWNVEVCEANKTHGDIRLGYLELYGNAPDASDDDKNALVNEKKMLEDNEKQLAEQSRFLAYCQEELERQRKIDEVAA